MSDETTDSTERAADGGRRRPHVDATRLRDLISRALWTVFVLIALVLATAAFSYALEANPDNDLVRLVRDLGDTFDLGFFDLGNPVKAFSGTNAAVKTALFNYGLASAAYLVIGRALERVIRP
ncbi:hypothetical protein [Nocardioides sp.]|uniref:hypothetical protein n=1 Tax=Nocardioides sp. TaxID=35761 RepID=UPI0035169EF0